MKDTVQIDFKVSADLLRFLQQPLERKEVENMLFEIDAVKFGADGTMTKAIKSGTADGEVWRPLSDNYYKYKESMLASGESIPNEKVPPKKVISTDIWIRTGKALEWAKTLKGGRLKKVVFRAMGLIKGGLLYSVDQQKIDYLEYPNETRPLIFWYKEDIKGINKAFDKFINVITKRFNKATGKKVKMLSLIGK